MKADYAFLADYAAERAGAVGAMGIGIDTLMTPQLPTTHPHIFLVLQLRCPIHERARHTIDLKVVGAGGEIILAQQGGVDFTTLPAGQEGVARLVFGFYLITFPKAGPYHFVVREGETVIANLPLLVLQSSGEPPAPPAQPREPRKRRRGQRD